MAGPEQRHDLRENLPVNHAQRDALLGACALGPRSRSGSKLVIHPK